MKEYKKPLEAKEFDALEFCIEQAKEMLGAYTGHPDKEVVKNYKKKLKNARIALEKVNFQNFT